MIKPDVIPIALDAGSQGRAMILVYRSLAWLSRLADFLHNWPGVALAIMTAFGTVVCSFLAAGIRSVVMTPTIPKTCFAISAVLAAWLLTTRKSR
jgi:hypothetical protein